MKKKRKRKRKKKEKRSVNESAMQERKSVKRKNRRFYWSYCSLPALAIILAVLFHLAGYACFIPALIILIPPWCIQSIENYVKHTPTIRNAGLVASGEKFIAFYRAENLERETRYSVEGWLEIHDILTGKVHSLHAEKKSYVDGLGETSGTVSLTFELPEGLSMKDIENEQMVSRTLDREQVIRRYSVEPCSVLIARMRKRK